MNVCPQHGGSATACELPQPSRAKRAHSVPRLVDHRIGVGATILWCLCVVAGWAQAAELAVYPAPAGIECSRTFTVRARSPGGRWQDVFCYDVQVDMHHPRHSSAAIFDFTGTVEVAVTYTDGPVRTARIRPTACALEPKVEQNTLTFALNQPRNLSVEVNGDIFDNLQLFAGPIEPAPNRDDPHVVFFGPGVHEPGPKFAISSGQIVYLAGGAVLKTTLVCDHVENVQIRGRGVLYHPVRGVAVTYARNVTVDGITVMNPTYYTVFGGQAQGLTIRNLKSFSSRGWSDGIDVMCCSDVLIDGVFMRNSDDCVAIYNHRWGFYGGTKNVVVQNSTLWADVAHPIFMGVHGNAAKPETTENLSFRNIDILDHDEPQIDYQGCFAIDVSDENLVRNVRVEDLRVEDFEQGQLVNLRVAFNRKYAAAPGRGIENVVFKNVTYQGTHANLSIIEGYDETRRVRDVVFENLRINGTLIRKPDQARFFIGEHTDGIVFRVSAPPGS